MANLLLKRIKDWATSITTFRTGDVIPVDGPSGTAKMSKDTLIELTAQNAVDKGIAASASNAGGIFVKWINNKGIYAKAGRLGDVVDSDISKCSDYIEINSEALYFKCFGRTTDTTLGVVFFDENKAPVSGITYGNQASNNSDFVYVSVPTGSRYVRFTYWMDADTYGNFEGFRIFYDLRLKSGELIADVGIGTNQDELVTTQKLSDSLCLENYERICPVRLYVGFISLNPVSYGVLDGTQVNYFSTDFIDVSSIRGKRINYARSIRNTQLSDAGIMFYDSNKAPVGGERIVYGVGLVDGVERRFIVVPPTASYVRVSYLKVAGADYSLFFEKKESKLGPSFEFLDGRFVNLIDNVEVGSVVSFVPSYLETLKCFVTTCNPGEQFILYGLGGKDGRLYAFLDIDRKLIVRCDSDDFLANGLVITAPPNAAYLVVNMRINYDVSEVYEFDDIFNKLNMSTTNGISKVVINEYSDVIATRWNYLVRCYDDNGTSMFAFSDDLGKTWTTSENTIGDVVRYHFFSNGDILVVCNRKAYTTRDFQTFTESTIYDYDGSIFAPDADYFFANQNGDVLMYSDGVEMYMFGDYTLVSGSPSRLWYTTDNGHTIRCAAKFGTTVMDGAVRNIRHVHSVVYNKYKDCFYITTGDASAECYYIQAKYNVTQDEWEWNVIANGNNFKFGNHLYDERFAYFVADYDPQLSDKKGMLRCPVDLTGDYSNYTQLYKAPQSEWGNKALSKFIYDQNGYKVILPDNIGYGSLWFARQGFDFEQITYNDESVLLSGNVIGPNYNGDVYITMYRDRMGERYTDAGNLRLNRKVVNLTKLIREQLEPNFFKNYNIDCF